MVIPAMGPADDSPFRYDRGRRGGASSRSADSAEAQAVSPREPALPRRRADRAGRRLHRPAGRDPARARDLPRVHRRQLRLAERQLGRAPELHRGVEGRGLPARAVEHRALHDRVADRGRGRGRDPRARADARLPRQVAPPPGDPAAVGGAGRADDDRVHVDPRPDLLDRELGARRDAPADAVLPPGEHRQLLRDEPAELGRQHDAREDLDHPRPLVADPPIRDGDLHRGDRVDPEGGRRRGGGRRRDGPAEVLVRQPAAAAADRDRRGAVRDRLHRDRHGRRLPVDARWPGEHDAHAHHGRVPGRDRVGAAGRRRGDLALPAACARRRRGRDAGRGAPRGGRVSAVADPAARYRRPRRARARAAFRRSGVPWLIAGPFAIVLAFPFYWMVITAFKQTTELYRLDRFPLWWHDGLTGSNVGNLFHHTPYLTWLGNTALVGVAVVAITLVLSLPAGYALARLSGRWGQSMGVGIFLTYLVPPTLLFLPLSRVIADLGLTNSLWSLILVYPSFTIPFSTWLLMGFFKTIPPELEDAALVDGASRIKTLTRIVFPISLPGILTVVIFSFSLVVNEFIYAITFISSSDQRTLSAGVPLELIRGDVYFWQSLMAATLIPAIPLALLYNMFLDRFIAGFTGGAFR